MKSHALYPPVHSRFSQSRVPQLLPNRGSSRYKTAVVGFFHAPRRPSPAESATPSLDQTGRIRTRAAHQPSRLLFQVLAEMHQQSRSDQLKSRGRVCCRGKSSFRDLGQEPASLGRDAKRIAFQARHRPRCPAWPSAFSPPAHLPPPPQSE